MEMLYIAVMLLQSMVISLGVGSSTIAIINFFVAIADGKIDPQERAMMGIVYKVLRISMIFILVCALLIAVMTGMAGVEYWSDFTAGMWTLIIVLYVNAVLMTKHIMPSNIGPALQASTWYTLGIIMSLIPLGLAGFSYFEFIVGYLAAVALAIGIVNGIMHYLKKQREA